MFNTSRPKTFYWIRIKRLMRTRREQFKTLKNLIGALGEVFVFNNPSKYSSGEEGCKNIHPWL